MVEEAAAQEMSDLSPECKSTREELSALIDGQLTGSLKTTVESHLESCPACQTELDSLKQVQSFLSGAFKSASEETPDIWSKIQGIVPSVCDVIQEDLSAYLDGELTVPAQEGVKEHLKDCAVCLGKFTDLNATNTLLAKGLELPASVSVDIWAGVNARLNADCALIDNELSAYLDQEVVTLRHRAITKHLTDCSNCQEEFSKLSSVGDLIRDAYKPNIPDNLDLWPGIKSKMQVVPFTPKAQTQQNKARGIDRRYYWGAAAAAACVAVFGMGALWLTAPSESSIKRVSAEQYLIDSSLLDPADKAETIIYEE